MQIIEITNTAIAAGKRVLVSQFFVADDAGELIGRKLHNEREAAEAEMGTLEGYSEGMEFAVAVGLDGKNAVAKANVVADYLAWANSGRPARGAESAAEQPVMNPEETF